ncbi:hypothetical protein [Roseateles sp. P5_E7]
MKHLFLILLPAALLGCAGPPPVEEKTAAAAGDTVCERSEVTGTRFTGMRCRTAAQREQDKRNVSDLEDVARRGAAVTKPGGS